MTDNTNTTLTNTATETEDFVDMDNLETSVPQELWEKAASYAWRTYPSGTFWDTRHFTGLLAAHGWVLEGVNNIWKDVYLPLAQWEADSRKGEWVYDPLEAEAYLKKIGRSYAP